MLRNVPQERSVDPSFAIQSCSSQLPFVGDRAENLFMAPLNALTSHALPHAHTRQARWPLLRQKTCEFDTTTYGINTHGLVPDQNRFLPRKFCLSGRNFENSRLHFGDSRITRLFKRGKSTQQKMSRLEQNPAYKIPLNEIRLYFRNKCGLFKL